MMKYVYCAITIICSCLLTFVSQIDVFNIIGSILLIIVIIWLIYMISNDFIK